jgi:hypothetical protein
MLSEVLPIIIYLLLIVLLIVAIILGIKLIVTMNKVDALVEDVTTKVKSLDRVFELVDFATERIEMIGDVAVNFVTTGFKKIFGMFKKTEKEDIIDE